jgi:hypothetical protein
MQPERWVEVADGYDTVYQKGERPERYKSPCLDDIMRGAPKEARDEWFRDTKESSSSPLQQ